MSTTRPKHYIICSSYGNRPIAVRDDKGAAVDFAAAYLMEHTDDEGTLVNPEAHAVYIRPSAERVAVEAESNMCAVVAAVDTFDRNDLAIGDVVRLKSGGPRMTIAGFEGNFTKCRWFNGGELEYSLFPRAATFKRCL